jgi:hypothetical protein
MGKPSLYGEERECWICHTPLCVEKHHIYQGSRRSISEREGCTVYLCHTHHQDQRFGVHYDADLMRFFKRDCQRRWEEREGKGHDEFRAVFYESYI